MAEPAVTVLLTDVEQIALQTCEQTIAAGLRTFLDVGNALGRIRDERLYRAQYGTFDAYCQQRWGISRPRAYELMGAAHAVSGMPDTDRPANARQAVELARTPEGERAEVWAAAQQRTGDPQPTAAVIRQVRADRASAAAEVFEEQPGQSHGPAPTDQVWIAAARRGIEAHRPDKVGFTACRRSTRTGLTLPAAQAVQRHQATWCGRCWPTTTVTTGTCERCSAVVPIADLVDPDRVHTGWCGDCRRPAIGADPETTTTAAADEDAPARPDGDQEPARVDEQALTLQQIGRLRQAFAWARYEGWTHTRSEAGDGVLRNHMERSLTTAPQFWSTATRVVVSWDHELSIGYTRGRYRLVDNVLSVVDVDQALDVLCALGLLPAELSRQYAAGETAGEKTGLTMCGLLGHPDGRRR